MVRTSALKPEIKRLYLKGISVTEICKRFPSAKSETIRRWVRAESWEVLLEESLGMFNKAPEVIGKTINALIEQLGTNLTDPDKTAKTCDSLVKLHKIWRTAAKEMDRLNQVLFVIGELGRYISLQGKGTFRDEMFKAKFDKLLVGFQNEMLKRYSPDNYD